MIAKIKLAKKKILPVWVHMTEELHMIRILDYKDKEWEGKNFKLNFRFESKWNTVTRIIRMNGFSIGISQKNVNDKWHPGYFSPFSDNFLPFLSNLLDLFSCYDILLFIGSSLISAERLSNPIFRHCSYVKVLGVGKFTEQKWAVLLKYAKPSNMLVIGCRMADDFIYPNIFNFPQLHVCFGEYINIDHLLNFNCERLSLDMYSISESDLNRFITNWLNGENQKFYRLRLHRFRNEPNWEVMLDGIENKKWDGKRRPRYFTINGPHTVWELDCKDGFDFERKDGKIGTVVQNAYHFEFLVWNDRNL
ncbi:unnamed protein product [Caenorhabditis brenneri]